MSLGLVKDGFRPEEKTVDVKRYRPRWSSVDVVCKLLVLSSVTTGWAKDLALVLKIA